MRKRLAVSRRKHLLIDPPTLRRPARRSMPSSDVSPGRPLRPGTRSLPMPFSGTHGRKWASSQSRRGPAAPFMASGSSSMKTRGLSGSPGEAATASDATAVVARQQAADRSLGAHGWPCLSAASARGATSGHPGFAFGNLRRPAARSGLCYALAPSLWMVTPTGTSQSSQYAPDIAFWNQPRGAPMATRSEYTRSARRGCVSQQAAWARPRPSRHGLDDNPGEALLARPA